MIWTVQGVRRLICGLRGHDAVLHFERHRLSLQCVRCGHETVGWQIGNDRSHSGSVIHAASIKPRGPLITTHSEIVGINMHVSVLDG
jgi:hypothetical protein